MLSCNPTVFLYMVAEFPRALSSLAAHTNSGVEIIVNGQQHAQHDLTKNDDNTPWKNEKKKKQGEASQLT